MALKERTHETQVNTKIVEAVETLSHIADMDVDKHVGITRKHQFILNDEKISYNTVHWLTYEEAEKTVEIVKDTFKTILHYLKGFYKKEYGYVSDPKAIEGIKAIMVLVGEAAKKLDQCTSLKDKSTSVTELKEYKQLQEFYLNRIARKIDESILGKWILGLTQVKQEKKNLAKKNAKLLTKHVFVDLESVKKDLEYELFFLKKEDGSKFYSPRLIRNIKLLCDFGDYFGHQKVEDPLVEVEVWLDRFVQNASRNILGFAYDVTNEFYHEVKKFKERELCEYLNKALIALVLSSHPRNLLENRPLKSCRDYFSDFQYFLRKALFSSDYHKLLAYPPGENNKLGRLLLKATEQLCFALYEVGKVESETISLIHHAIQEAVSLKNEKESKNKTIGNSLSGILGFEYSAMNRFIKKHPYGALTKILNSMQQGLYGSYDPLLQKILPLPLFQLDKGDEKIQNIAMAGPLSQEYIHMAYPVDEFKAYLHLLKKQNPHKNFLLFNFQDRLSWKEEARSRALENLQNQEDSFKIVTMPRNSDFYLQQNDFKDLNQFHAFQKAFKEQIEDPEGGFYFPQDIAEILMPKVDLLLNFIHTNFFSHKNVLSREQRLNFIEIFYLFSSLIILDQVKPARYAVCCKDGVDGASLFNALCFCFIKLLNQEILNEKDKEYADWMIYFPALFHRERLPLPDRFSRMLGALGKLEQSIKEKGKDVVLQTIEEQLDLKIGNVF